jgi:hypothetical protein
MNRKLHKPAIACCLFSLLQACAGVGTPNAGTPSASAPNGENEFLKASATPTLLVANKLSVTMYGVKNGNLKRTISRNVTQARGILFNSSGDLVVANGGSSIGVYAPNKYNEIQRFQTTKPRAIALDSQGNLYVLSSAKVTEYAPGTSEPYSPNPARTITSGIKDGEALTVDAADNVYVANYATSQNGGNTVTVYSPDTSAPTQTISQGVNRPYCLSLDSSQDLAVGNLGNNSVTIYSSGTMSLVKSITSGVSSPYYVLFDSAGDLYVANGPGSVTTYKSGGFHLARTITDGISVPSSLLLDTKGDLFVASQGNNSVSEYSRKSDSPMQTISQGVEFPYDLAIKP